MATHIKPLLWVYDGNNRYTGIGMSFSNYIDARVLAATVAERHTIPTGAKKVFFSANADFYAKFGGDTVTAAIPAADVTDGSGSELNPVLREIGDAGYISVISATDGAVITLAFYS